MTIETQTQSAFQRISIINGTPPVCRQPQVTFYTSPHKRSGHLTATGIYYRQSLSLQEPELRRTWRVADAPTISNRRNPGDRLTRDLLK